MNVLDFSRKRRSAPGGFHLFSSCSSSGLIPPPHRAVSELQIPPDPQQLTGTFSPLLNSHGHACVLLQGKRLCVGLQGIFYSHCIQAAVPFPTALTFNSNAGTESWKENVFNASPARGLLSLVHTQACGNHCLETSAAFQQQSALV